MKTFIWRYSIRYHLSEFCKRKGFFYATARVRAYRTFSDMDSISILHKVLHKRFKTKHTASFSPTQVKLYVDHSLALFECFADKSERQKIVSFGPEPYLAVLIPVTQLKFWDVYFFCAVHYCWDQLFQVTKLAWFKACKLFRQLHLFQNRDHKFNFLLTLLK